MAVRSYPVTVSSPPLSLSVVLATPQFGDHVVMVRRAGAEEGV